MTKDQGGCEETSEGFTRMVDMIVIVLNSKF